MSPHVTQMSVSEAPDPSAAPSPRVFPQVSQAKKTPLSPCHPRDFKTKYGNSAATRTIPPAISLNSKWEATIEVSWSLGEPPRWPAGLDLQTGRRDWEGSTGTKGRPLHRTHSARV